MINLIVATHGKMSEETVNLTKMVLGESEQLDFVTFVPGEGPEDLIKKYQDIIAKYDSEGTLFLVDLFGGSPYNAACRVVAETENTDVITGVNVPMLLEVLDAREETNDVALLVISSYSCPTFCFLLNLLSSTIVDIFEDLFDCLFLTN